MQQGSMYQPDAKFQVMYEALSLSGIGLGWLSVAFLVKDWTVWIDGIFGGIIIIVSFVLLLYSFRIKCAEKAKAVIDKLINLRWMIVYMSAAMAGVSLIVTNAQNLQIVPWLVWAMFFFFTISVGSMISDLISKVKFKSVQEAGICEKKLANNLALYLTWLKSNWKSILIVLVIAIMVIVIIAKIVPAGIQAIKEELSSLIGKDLTL